MIVKPCGCAFTSAPPTGWWLYPCDKHKAAYKKRAASYRNPIPPQPDGPTVEQLQAEIASLKSQLSAVQDQLVAVKEAIPVAYKLRKKTGVRAVSKETWSMRSDAVAVAKFNRAFDDHEVVALIVRPE